MSTSYEGQDAHHLSLSTPRSFPQLSQQQDDASCQHLDEQQLGTTPDCEQGQQQEDTLTVHLKQTLISEVAAFFQSEIAPRSLDITQNISALTYEAQQLAAKADHEKQAMLAELERLHKLVASFQAQIREALGDI